MLILAVLFGPAVLGAGAGLVVAGLVGAVVGAVAGFLLGLGGLAGVLTPWVTRAIAYQHGLLVHGSRWRGRLEVWDLPAREVTVVRGWLRPRAETTRLDRRATPPPAPRRPPAIPGLWPLPDDARDAPQVQRALARVRAYRAPVVTDRRPRRGR